MENMADDRVLPREHPHEDRRNWRPEDDDIADELDQLGESVWADMLRRLEGGERIPEAEVAKAMGCSRKHWQDVKVAVAIPDEFFELVMTESHNHQSFRDLFGALARLIRYYDRGHDWSQIVEQEHCPHCGGVTKERWRVPKWMVDLWNGLLDEHRSRGSSLKRKAAHR